MVSGPIKWILLPLKAHNLLLSWLKGVLACWNSIKGILTPIGGFSPGSKGKIKNIIKKGITRSYYACQRF